MKIIGIDPGLQGAMVVMDQEVSCSLMPLTAGEKKEVDFWGVHIALLDKALGGHVFLERAMPMAMGSKHAFNYGRGFAAIEIAIKLLKVPVTYVEPTKWMKVMLDGTDSRLKPKERASIAFDRLFPGVQIPTSKTGKKHEGIVDAFLIAEYGRRILGGNQ